jgi:hypothetical protein
MKPKHLQVNGGISLTDTVRHAYLQHYNESIRVLAYFSTLLDIQGKLNLNSSASGQLNGPLQFFARHQQTIKWVVYTLLVLNFGYYLFDDWRTAQSTLLPDASFLEIASTYATTFDELGWFGLLFLLEVETYWIEDDTELGPVYWLMQFARVICYVVVTHTLFAFIVTLIDLGNASILTDAGGLCALVGEDLSFTRNLLYELVETSNCANLSAGGEIYRFVGEPVVSDSSGYQLAVWHAWADVVEIAGWLSISLLITFVMVLQSKGIYQSLWIRGADVMQYIVYAIVAGTAVYWSIYGYYVYTWDILLWIGGFVIIDANLAEWRHELEDEGDSVESKKVQDAPE